MKKTINWKNATITILAAGNLLFSIDGSYQQHKINKLESDVHNLKSELYFLEIEAGLYNEYPDTVARDPMRGGDIK